MRTIFCPTTVKLSSTFTSKKGIRSSPMWDTLLLKAVIYTDAHLSPDGEAQGRFEETLTLFQFAFPSGASEGICLPTWKTLRDRFKKIVADHKTESQCNATPSDIIEIGEEQRYYWTI
ncbi:unnamed protein product [Chondrus crispus]|uniref:MADF domain-containing protein n=1 Tax=Chondrus crispus TaxID=2769 RepID=R7Q1N5_CHOCR|nr:unnamed protein product [Chondrus crispus]CDF32477.1 unnamed protein product [Chondrus crispus]|eukprot:XP_005712142.1 unnamed protein product [Chondrus crispus]